MNGEAYYPHVARCRECGFTGLCPTGVALAREMVWLKCRRGFWKDSVTGSPVAHKPNVMPGKGVNPGTFQP